MRYYPCLDLDVELGGVQRPHLLAPGQHHLHSRGRRLWATHLASALGFRGRLHWVHKTNIPSLFDLRLTVDGSPVQPELRGHLWFPSRLQVRYAAGPLEVEETKFLTADDLAVSIVQVTNASGGGVRAGLSATSELAGSSSAYPSVGQRRIWGYDVCFVLRSLGGPGGPGWEKRIAAGGCLTVAFVMVVGLPGEAGAAVEGAGAGGEDFGNDPMALLARHLADCRRWDQAIPVFRCDRPALERMWAYRWLVNKVNLANPGLGGLAEPLYYEGRAHKGSQEPWADDKGGFARLIPFSTPCHLLEGRWHADPAPVFGEVLNAVRNPGDAGRLTTVSVAGALPRGFYNHFAAWAAWQAYLVHRDRAWLHSVVDGLERDLQAWLADGPLPVIYDHNKTGMEYQPSYWYFTGYPSPPAGGQPESGGLVKPPGLDRFTPMRRVDTAVYTYLNARGLAAICEELGRDEQAAGHRRTAEVIGRELLARMWDPESRFFYDLHHETLEKAYVKNIVGFLPLLTGLCGDEHAGALTYLADPGAFGTPFPFPSAARDCPMYAPDATVAGVHIKGPRGCVWNGPSWPMANSLVIDALAAYSKQVGHRFDEAAFQALVETTDLVFQASSYAAPSIVEHYNPETGSVISGEEEYFHSYYIDLIVRHVAGVTPGPGELPALDPLRAGCRWFCLQDLPYAGRRLTVTWRDPDAEVDVPWDAGYRCYADGTLVYQSSRLERIGV